MLHSHFPNLSALAVAGSALALALALSSASDQSRASISESQLAAAGELFESVCSSCHLPPDPELRDDRAWLNQIKDTA